MNRITVNRTSRTVVIECHRNTDTDFQVLWTDTDGNPINVTGMAAEFTVAISEAEPTPLIHLTEGSGITLGGALGTVDVHVPAATNGTLAARTVYGCDLVVGGRSLLFGSYATLPSYS